MWFGFDLLLRWNLFRVGLLALPLCGAAVTFFAAAKKVTKESSFFRQQCKDVATVALLSGPAPKCRPQKTEGLGARHALCHRAVNELAQQSFIRFRFAGREVHSSCGLGSRSRLRSAGFRTPVVRAKRGRTATQCIPLCWSARGVSACARQAGRMFEGDT